MSLANFVIEMHVYDDSTTTNDPKQRLFDYKKSLSIADLGNANVQILELTQGQLTAISIPNDATWIYIETNQAIHARFNGDTTANNKIEPSVSGTSDGVLFKRGEFTSLSINVPGATNANVKIFMGS